MPNSMEPVYRQTASQTLQIILQHHQIGSENPLTLLQLLLADEEDPELTIRMSTKPSTAEEEKARCRATHIRLLHQCCGLLEISGSMSPQAVVGFLHQKVVEFLNKYDIQQFLLDLNSRIAFDPNISLLISSLAMLKLHR